MVAWESSFLRQPPGFHNEAKPGLWFLYEGLWNKFTHMLFELCFCILLSFLLSYNFLQSSIFSSSTCFSSLFPKSLVQILCFNSLLFLHSPSFNIFFTGSLAKRKKVTRVASHWLWHIPLVNDKDPRHLPWQCKVSRFHVWDYDQRLGHSAWWDKLQRSAQSQVLSGRF